MAKKKTSKTNPLLNEAVTATNASYLPQLQQLALLRDTTAGDYTEGLSQANQAARMIAAGNTQASGGLADFLARAGASQIKGPSNSEAALVAQNLGLSSQAAGAGLANSTKRGYEAALYQGQGLRKDYLKNAGQIDTQARQLAQQQGADTLVQYNKLVDAQNAALADAQAEAAKEQFTAGQNDLNRTVSLATAGVNPDGSIIKGGKADKPSANSGLLPGGIKPATNDSFKSFQKNYQAGVATASALKKSILKGKISTASAITAIANGVPAKTTTEYVLDPATGKPLTNKDGSPKVHQVTRPAVKGIDDPIAARAALEYVLHGGITSSTAAQLHAQGIKVKRLGVGTVSRGKVAADIKARPVQKAAINVADAISGIKFG